MFRFALLRTLRALTVLFGVSALTFVIGHHSGDPVLLIVRGDATAEQKADLRHSLGLDRPLAEGLEAERGEFIPADQLLKNLRQTP